MRTARLVGSGAAVTLGFMVASVAPALAHECYNASKQPGAGAQIVFDENTGEIVFMTEGLERRISQGLINLDTGEGFSGLIGIDFDGDGSADATTYIVGPDAEIPEQAQDGGDPCHGVTNFETFFSQCL